MSKRLYIFSHFPYFSVSLPLVPLADFADSFAAPIYKGAPAIQTLLHINIAFSFAGDFQFLRPPVIPCRTVGMCIW